MDAKSDEKEEDLSVIEEFVSLVCVVHVQQKIQKMQENLNNKNKIGDWICFIL